MTHIDLITECGFNKPLTKLELSDRVTIVQAVALHKVILSTLAELTQFREGLASLGVATKALFLFKQHGVNFW